jgi:hypothetical protein
MFLDNLGRMMYIQALNVPELSTCCPSLNGESGRDVLKVVEVSLVKIRNKNIKIRNK